MPKKLSKEMAEYAAKGAKRLDTVLKGQEPKWAERVDQDRLNILDPHNDILGQVFGSYKRGLKATKLSEEASPEHGFTLPDEYYNDPEAKEKLEEAWVKEANERL